MFNVTLCVLPSSSGFIYMMFFLFSNLLQCQLDDETYADVKFCLLYCMFKYQSRVYDKHLRVVLLVYLKSRETNISNKKKNPPTVCGIFSVVYTEKCKHVEKPLTFEVCTFSPPLHRWHNLCSASAHLVHSYVSPL